jgi:hypothetical protein
MVRLPEIFHWMSEDERWRYKIVFQGLILLIPVVGVIALLGWLSIICDNLMAGRQDVPPAGFHLRRGVNVFAIGIIYWFGLSVPLEALLYANALWHGALPLGQVAAVYNDLALLLYVVLIVPLFVATNRDGFLGGLNLVAIIFSVLSRPIRTIVATLVVLIAIAIGILGFALLFVGALITIPYAGSIVATIAAWWALPRERRAQSGAGRSGPNVPFRPPGVEAETPLADG